MLGGGAASLGVAREVSVARNILPGLAKSAAKGVSVLFEGKQVSVFRGGKDFTLKPGEIKIDSKTGLVKLERGVSINVKTSEVIKYGGAYKIESLPKGLKIVHQGKNAAHFEIIPAKNMSADEFQKLLNQIKTTQAK